MEVTHFGHACVLVDHDGTRLLFDPGTLSDGFLEVGGIDGILITHAHPDHLDPARLAALTAGNPGAKVVIDRGSAAVLRRTDMAFQIAEPGVAFGIGKLTLTPTGGHHATVHADVPVISNCGYIVGDGDFLHPGDSFDVPDCEIDVLALPTSGPWLKLAESIDYLRAISPRVAVPIHEAALSSTATHFGILRATLPTTTSFVELEHGVPADLSR